ncbi:MAG: Ku protein [Gemmatimonadetes bacterium]|jgi:DNA end-binding protein Ku|nr:Ku protein [Gemmatimonadota bacterium]MBT5054924.1 Ku protein [Gemmatimonadota bacterium]MBT5145845.1 Ku protein [Gemmatimonadota bacterium]MBT5587826.1 Ku protein [Gemmatimonadota bacterium]MBT5963000.1 Ku protein [Gemmatimonadota bacterium]
MNMRSLWKGHIRFSMVTIPVRLYNAVDSGSSIRFNQLHKEDHGRIKYDKVCRSCSETLSGDEIIKGYEYAPDEYVVVDDEDFEKVKLKSTKIIEIEGFVDVNDVDVSMYDTPYYAGPDGDVAVKVFALLSQSLTQSGKLGVGKVVLRDREDMVLIGAQGNGIVIYKVRYPQFVRKMDDVPGLADSEVSADELKLAQSLIDSMSKDLADIEIKDTYHEAVQEMIQAKVDGKEVVMAAEDEVKPVVDIMTALKESIAAASGEAKPMERATGESEEAEVEDADVEEVDEADEAVAPKAKKKATAKAVSAAKKKAAPKKKAAKAKSKSKAA